MIPDKIYIRDFGNTLCKVWTYEPGKRKADVDIAYIRKDAILEWAENWKKLGVSEDFLYAMEVLKQHLGSL